MEASLKVEEVKSKYWRPLTIFLGIICIIFFVLFWNLEDPFWVGIFRIISFLCFAGTIFGALKLMEGNLKLNLEITDQDLTVRYLKKERTVHKESYKLSTINNIFPVVPNENWSLPFLQNSFEGFLIDFSDSDQTLFLFEFGGRPLVFSEENRDRIIDFLSSYQLIDNSKTDEHYETQ